jgi:pyridoxal phosphate enzyme (YggS family)
MSELKGAGVALVAVSKIRTANEIIEAYNAGQMDFGENYVQELVAKHEELPKNIRWHFIGHLQSNKVKYITSFVYLIQGVDSKKLLAEINKQAGKENRVINCLLQVHIAEEETKFGFNETELNEIDPDEYKNINIAGLMGMASFSDDENKVRHEFKKLKRLFDTMQLKHSQIRTLSMGMSGDYKLAIEEGSNMVRIGSLLFGVRPKII